MENLFTVKTKEIFLDKETDISTINPFGDIHRDSPSCDVERWEWWLARMKKKHDKHTYYIGMGDYTDFASTSEKAILKNPKLHDDTVTTFDEVSQFKNRSLAKELSFAKSNLLGLLEGNHHWVMANGQTSTDDLAGRLGVENLGYLCYLNLKYKIKQPGGASKHLTTLGMVLCHGKAGGKTAGVTINQVDDLRKIFPVADIYVMGHDHQRGAWPQSCLVPFFDKKGDVYIKQKRQFLARSGSFLKAYSPNKQTYSVKSLYKPADLGAVQFKVSFHRDKNIGDRIITDIEAII